MNTALDISCKALLFLCLLFWKPSRGGLEL